MDRIDIADARDQFDAIIERAANGEQIEIIDRGGRPIVSMGPAARKPKKIDVDALRALTATMTFQTERSGDLIRRMRDEGY